MTSTAQYFDARAASYDAGVLRRQRLEHRPPHRLAAGPAPPAARAGPRRSSTPAAAPASGAGSSRRRGRPSPTATSPQMVEQAVGLARAANPGAAQRGGYSLGRRARGLADASFDLALCMGDPLSYAGDPPRGIRELCASPGRVAASWSASTAASATCGCSRSATATTSMSLARFLETGDLPRSWEGLPLHAFAAEELRRPFDRAGADTVAVWSSPPSRPISCSIQPSAPACRSRLRRPPGRAGARRPGAGRRAGTHHLYGVFRRR